jgi:DNA-binding Lrp family transcriptional regulator
MVDLDHYDREIIYFLGHRGDSTTNYIADELGLSWATVNEHLKKLTKLGIVKAYKKDRTDKVHHWKLIR